MELAKIIAESIRLVSKAETRVSANSVLEFELSDREI